MKSLLMLIFVLIALNTNTVHGEPSDKLILYGTDIYPYESPKPYPLMENLVVGNPIPLFFAPQLEAFTGILPKGSRIDILYAVIPEEGSTAYYKIRTEEGENYYVPVHAVRIEEWKRTIRLEY